MERFTNTDNISVNSLVCESFHTQTLYQASSGNLTNLTRIPVMCFLGTMYFSFPTFMVLPSFAWYLSPSL